MGARKLRLSATLAAVLAAVSLSTPPAQAAITDAVSMPAKVSVGTNGPARVTVDWRLQRENVNPPTPGTVSSASLRILVGSSLVATQPRSLSLSVQGLTVSETVNIREVLQIPEAAVYRAIKQGQPLRVTREFKDSSDNYSETAELLVTPSGAGSVALSVQRLALNFDDDSRSRILSRGDEVRIVAEITTSGIGLIVGQWEVATGSATAGTPVFRPLSLVRQGVAGGGRTVITSPPLPTAEQGTNFARFRLIDPALSYDTPTLQYYVAPKKPLAAAVAEREILISAPRPGAALTAETRFAWNAISGSNAYQLSFYAKPAGTAKMAPDGGAKGEIPLAGTFVAADQTEATLAAFTLAQLAAGESYLWKVVAIDANGAVIGSSSMREIYKP